MLNKMKISIAKFWQTIKKPFAKISWPHWKHRKPNFRFLSFLTKRSTRFNLVWWKVILLGIAMLYFIVGVVFGVIVYKKYPDNLAKNKQYPDQQTITMSMIKIYPFPAGWVNYRPIWMKDYYKQLSYVRHFSTKTQQDMPANSQLQNQVLDQMIETELLRQQAIKYDIKVSVKDVDDTFNKISEENQGEKQVADILNELYGMSVKDFKMLVRDQLVRQKIQDELFIRVQAEHILIKDESKANDVLSQVKKGDKSFEDLAKEFSEDTGSRDNGGALGWFGRGMMVKEFEDAVFIMNKGDVSQNLIKSEFGFHIIKLIDKSGKIDQSYTEWFDGLKKEAKIYRWVRISTQSENTNVITPETTASAEPTATPASL